MASMPSTTTECMEEETHINRLSTLCITNKNSVPVMGGDLQPAVAEDMGAAATERSGGKVEETCNYQKTNAASKQKKNKNAVVTKTSDLIRNNSKSNDTECVQDGIASSDRNEGTDIKHIDHRETVLSDDETNVKQIEDKVIIQAMPTRPITAETGAIPKTSLSNNESIKAQREMKTLDTQISTLSVDGGEQDANSMVIIKKLSNHPEHHVY